MRSTRVPYGEGRARLLAAAARWMADHGSLAGLTLRSLAALAGISHNAIYRHYRSVEDMAIDLATDFAQQLRSGLSQARDEVKSGEGPSRTVVSWLFDFALSHPAHFKTAHLTRMGPPGTSRELLEAQLVEIRLDMRAQLAHKKMLPEMPEDDLDAALALIIDTTFQLCIRCIEAPEQRPALLLRAEQVFTWVLAGAALTAQRGNPPTPGP
jgi:TetR/AcrR family transcriptional regulator, fatty acid biosynthesis regulator